MTKRVVIVDRDRGYRRLLRELDKKGAVVEVGVLGPSAAEPKAGSGELSVVDVATIHEFGTARIPKRSFIAGWFDENVEENRAFLRYLAERRIESQGAFTYEQALTAMGVRAVGGIQKRMADGIDPPLAESTIRAKGSSTPLIDTGQLRSSVSFRVGKASGT